MRLARHSNAVHGSHTVFLNRKPAEKGHAQMCQDGEFESRPSDTEDSVHEDATCGILLVPSLGCFQDLL